MVVSFPDTCHSHDTYHVSHIELTEYLGSHNPSQVLCASHATVVSRANRQCSQVGCRLIRRSLASAPPVAGNSSNLAIDVCTPHAFSPKEICVICMPPNKQCSEFTHTSKTTFDLISRPSTLGFALRHLMPPSANHRPRRKTVHLRTTEASLCSFRAQHNNPCYESTFPQKVADSF